MSARAESLAVSLLPMTSIDHSLSNIEVISKAISSLDSGVRLLCLPENSLYLNLSKQPIPQSAAFSQDSPEIKTLQELARKNNLNIHLGGIPWWIDGKVYNEALLIRDSGEIVETYEKLHLFDVNLGPGIEICESKSYAAGSRFGTFEIDGWRFATCICYDLRFPEIFIHYAEKEKVDAFLVPAAFTTKTGAIHWKPLLTARAIETQAYVLAAAQVGFHRNPEKDRLRKSWGQSLIISPWGKIIQETSSYKAFADSNLTEHPAINTVLEESQLTEYRRAIPVTDHRVYQMELVKK